MRARARTVLAALPILATAAGCSGSSAGTPAPSHPNATRPAIATRPASTARSTGKPTAGPASCPTGPDILQWEHDPGTTPYVSRLGAYTWYAAENRCVDSVTFAQATIPQVHGVCIQIALARDNPGYNEDADPAPRLHHIEASLGDGC